MSDDGLDELNPEQQAFDYDILDEETGFKKYELEIWNAFETQYLKVPEDDRAAADPESWAEEHADETRHDKNRCTYVVTLGIYAGPRDEFNQRSGNGKSIYASGDRYEGDFFEGKRHGSGQYIFYSFGKCEVDRLIEKEIHRREAQRKRGRTVESDEAFASRVASQLMVGVHIVSHSLEFGLFPCYHGEYIRGKRTGQGLMKNKDGTVYKGDFIENKREGQGIFYYVNGDIYSGNWKAGLKHGYGTYRFATGGEYRGEWLKGIFQQGQWILPDGTYFEGLFDRKNRPCDEQGTMHFPQNRTAVVGVYKRHKWAPLANLISLEETPVDGTAWCDETVGGM